ncbi:IPT/TIG domain-containing protein [Asanoa iriomotensis]|uniref:IPT/TIG domain-containing protein n=1 Tax=Asanoa iriomotensis TaxID=234613 RepID=A0ABQ4BYH9_9ACTN|nr:IPT/TIG domain-containing protein [Asanoa iriomotensis]GIF55587.1 hypothetical protein Air01nite_16820 [Asanoa iriomotensis]
MGIQVVKGDIGTGAGRAQGVPGLRVDLWERTPTGDRHAATTLTDHAGQFTVAVDDATGALTAVVTDRHGTQVHRGPLEAARSIGVSPEALAAHLAEPILIDRGAPPLDPDGLVHALRELMTVALPHWSPAALDRVFVDLRCPIPGTATFAALGREAQRVLDGDARAGVAFAAMLGGSAEPAGGAPCAGCAGTRASVAREDPAPLYDRVEPYVAADHSVPLIAAAALLEASGKFGGGLVLGVVDRLCSLERLGQIHLLALEVAGDRAALGNRLEGLLGPGGPFPECPRGPKLPDLPVPAFCEPLRRCGDAAGGTFGGVASYVINAVSPPVACPGDTVTLSGFGFGSIPGTVSFGGATATASAWSDTSITVTAPAGARNPLGLILPTQKYLICGRLVEARPTGTVTADFAIGVPVIEAFFAGSPWNNPYCVEPGAPIPLQWRVSGANHVRVEVRDQNGTVVAASDPAPAHGIFASLTAAQTNATTTWTARITASGVCGGPAQAQVAIRITRDPMLVISGIEVTQAIQHFQSYAHLTDAADRGPDNSLVLAAGKAAFVRVYPQSVRDPAFNQGILGQIDGSLTVERLGANGVWQPVPDVTPTGAPLFVTTGARPVTFRASDTYDDRRRNLPRSLNWIIPAGVMTGRLRIGVAVRTGEELCGRPPVTGAVEVSTIVRQLRIAVVRVGYDGPPSATSPAGTPAITVAAPPLGNVNATAGYTLATYPVDAQLTVRDAGTATATLPLDDPVTTPGGCTPNWGSLLSLVQTARTNDGNQPGFFYYGLIGSGTPVGMVIGCEGSTAAGFDGNGTTLAHELGHALGRPHAPCGNVGAFDAGYPFYEPHDAAPPVPPALRASASIGEYGLDIRSGTIMHPATNHDFMSYCGPRWVSIRGHDLSANAPLLGAPAPTAVAMEGAAMAGDAGPVDVVSVIGQFGGDGRLHIESVARVTTHTDLPGWLTHEAVAELLDDAGTVLSSARVRVRSTTAACGCSGAAGAAGPSDAEPGPSVFQAFLPPAPEAVVLRVRVGDDRHDERRARAFPPRVAVTSSTVERDGVRLTWSAELAPDATPEVWIQAAERGRDRWRGVTVDAGDGAATIPLSALPAGRTRLRVLLHDGFSTAQATGPVIDLPAREPTVSIVHPPDGAVVDPDAPGLAWAATLDTAEPVTWLLDGATIGTGVQLPLPALAPGAAHTLEARVAGASATVTFRAGDR